MKTLFIDCGMGASGDMLTAALLELIPDREAFIKRMNSIGIPGVEVKMESCVKCGITGTHVTVTVNGEEETETLHASAACDDDRLFTFKSFQSVERALAVI